MIITIDVGNSNIVLGAYRNGKVQFVSRLATDTHREADQYAVEMAGIFRLYNVPEYKIKGVVLSSVVPSMTATLVEAMAHFYKAPPLVLSLENRGDIEVKIDQPAELGMDILASAIAAKHSYALPAVVIDMGTATKLIALDKNGDIQGVSIAPGLYLSLNALVQGTSLLRGISAEAPPNAIGKNTVDSMKSGMILGTAAMLDGLLDRFKRELGGLESIIATGGAAPVVIPYCKHNITYSDTLLIDGLYHAYMQAEAEKPRKL